MSEESGTSYSPQGGSRTNHSSGGRGARPETQRRQCKQTDGCEKGSNTKRRRTRVNLGSHWCWTVSGSPQVLWRLDSTITMLWISAPHLIREMEETWLTFGVMMTHWNISHQNIKNTINISYKNHILLCWGLLKWVEKKGKKQIKG